MSETSTHTLAGLLATLSPDAHTRGKQFEHISKWWLSNTPVKPFGEHTVADIWLWDEWPDRPGPDIGIDLVARLSDGSLCAIQAKCIDESADIPKSQLDSFISAASTRIYTHRLLIATTDGLSANARRMLQEQHVIRVMRTELENSLSIWPDGIDKLATPLDQPKWVPRPHQQEAITNVVSGLQEHDRGQLIMACGTGKTLTALWITEQLNPQTTLVLVPSLSLLSQTLSEWAQHTNTTWSYICVCSDDTVNKHNDEPISTVDDFPFEVTTNPDRITHFLATPGKKVIFSTYQSSAQVAASLHTSGTTIDLAICDEAHRLTGKTAADYATILDNNKIPATKRLFMTATPRTYTASIKKRAEERGVEVTSMDNKTIYGPVLHKLSFGEAIARELLSDYQVVIVGTTDQQVQDLIDQRELVSLSGQIETDARTLAAHIGLAKATGDYDLSRIISFHSRINTAAKFAREHPKIISQLPDTHRPRDKTWTGTISGAMNTGQRRNLLRQLGTQQLVRHALLTNARCLTEGVDIPALDGIAFIDPRSSQVDIIQAVGRAIRKSNGKSVGTIVIPVLIPMSPQSDATTASAYGPVFQVINALKSHDDILFQELAELRRNLGQRLGTRIHLPKKIIIDLPRSDPAFLESMSQAISLEVVTRATQSWDQYFGAVAAFSAENGHARILQDQVYNDLRVGYWVSHQRLLYSRSLLEQDKINQLESLPTWTWNEVDQWWADACDYVAQFSSLHGHTAIPPDVIGAGVRLSTWIKRQRSVYHRGEMPQNRIDQLEAIAGWSWTPEEDKWQMKYEALRAYSEFTGDSNAPRGTQFNGVQIGSWVDSQRGYFRKGTLPEHRKALLERLPNWKWEPKDNFDDYLKLARSFVAREGHCNIPQQHIEDGKKLGIWVSNCRRRWDRLAPNQQAQLSSLPGWTLNIRDTQWPTMFDQFVKFRLSTISLTPHYLTEGELKKLDNWEQNQRAFYRRGTLTIERIEQLEGVPGWDWNKEFDRWNVNFLSVRNLLSKGEVVKDLVAGDDRLGKWLRKQIRAFRNKDLIDERIELLQKLPGWSWDLKARANTDQITDQVRF